MFHIMIEEIEVLTLNFFL